MAEQTANYQLVKPAPEEFYDRTIDNENLDKIDRAIKEAKDAAGNIDLTEIEQSIEDLETQLDSKADSEHRHTIADVESLQSTLENKANNSHIHAISDITNLQTSLDSKASNSDVDNLQQQVANNQSNVSTLQQQVTKNQKEVAQHLAQEATLTTKGHVQLQTTIDSSETKAVTPLGVYNHAKDYVKHPAYASTTGTNSYAVTLNPAPTSLVEGMGIVIKVINAATGNCTLNVNGLGAKNIVKTDGTIVTDLKSNAVYTLRYSGTAFILQGEGGGTGAIYLSSYSFPTSYLGSYTTQMDFNNQKNFTYKAFTQGIDYKFIKVVNNQDSNVVNAVLEGNAETPIGATLDYVIYMSFDSNWGNYTWTIKIKNWSGTVVATFTTGVFSSSGSLSTTYVATVGFNNRVFIYGTYASSKVHIFDFSGTEISNYTVEYIPPDVKGLTLSKTKIPVSSYLRVDRSTSKNYMRYVSLGIGSEISTVDIPLDIYNEFQLISETQKILLS